MLLALSLVFERPWLLLLLIPFLALTVIPYFTLSKRYRKTRNRITSMVLHGVISVLAVLLLSGLTIVNTIVNNNNEIILLVDVSNSEEYVAEQRDDFVNAVINESKFNNFKIGIVTFGYDQEYAVELTRDYKNVYSTYLSAELPDISATNIAAALKYTKGLFTEGNTQKIVLITDCKETDETARSVIRSIVAGGTAIDTVYVPSDLEEESDFQILSAELPNYHINKDETFQVSIDVFSSFQAEVNINLYDNDQEIFDASITKTLIEGLQTYVLKHTFETDGLHKLTFEIEYEDLYLENNRYDSYIYVEPFNKILVIEQEDGQSELIDSLLKDFEFEVTIINVNNDDLPEDINTLLQYDEVIMNNIANDDLNDEFVELLNTYVSEYGGGLLTTGGVDDSDEAHAYNREDLKGTEYQKMLPVQAIDYTPPVGVIVIIDISGSMSGADEYGNSLLDWARAGATSCLNALTERDYFGLMTLESDYGTVLPLTPRTQEAKILAAIDSIRDATGGTTFSGAIERAGQELRSLKVVDKKHIIIVSDGQVGERPEGGASTAYYEDLALEYYETDGITISVIGVTMNVPYNSKALEDENYPWTSISFNTSAYHNMLRLTKMTHGRLHVISEEDRSKIASEMREDLNAKEIKEVNFEDYNPVIVDATSSLFANITRLEVDANLNKMDVVLQGYNGVKVRGSASLMLTGDYNVPLYAYWKYGNGMVGSFMCDVYGNWSSEFMDSENGQQFLVNVINSLTPTESIRVNDIRLVLQESNYTNSLSVFTDLEEGDYIKGTLQYSDNSGDYEVSLNLLPEDKTAKELREMDAYVISNLSVDNNYSRTKFVIRNPGTYTICIEKYNAQNELIGSNTIYKSFSYSKEYDLNNEEEINYAEKMKLFSVLGNGVYIDDLEDPSEIVNSFDVVLYNVFDPRLLFAIICIVFFLLDVAVRKFKFKWPHEIIQNYKRKKGMK